MIVALIILLMNLLGLMGVITLLFVKEKPIKEPEQWPPITVWVAARNEEENISECLECLGKLDYPSAQLQILVGDDLSSDLTAELIHSFVKNDPRFVYCLIEKSMGRARNKANVLAHLAHRSSGTFFLICDADMRVHTGWAKEMVAAFQPDTGVVSASVWVKPDRLFAHFQGFEWLYLGGLFKASSVLGIKAAATGNNMALRKEAYWATGGYEKMETSITEDLQIYLELMKRNFGWKHLVTTKSTSTTLAVNSLSHLAKQRKRWMTGSMALPFFWKAVLVIYALSFPAAIFLLFSHYILSGPMLFGWVILQVVLMLRMAKLEGKKINLIYGTLYPLYSALLVGMSAFLLAFPVGKEWKSRKF